MFNNIIYFIIVLLIFHVNVPDEAPRYSLAATVAVVLLGWGVFAVYCRWEFGTVLRRLGRVGGGRLAARYQRSVNRLSIAAVLLFGIAVYLGNLKYWLQLIPGFNEFSVLQGSLALSLFFLYLATIWYFGHSVYQEVFESRVPRRSFIRSNLKLNLPIVFPWFVLSLGYDGLLLSGLVDPGRVLGSVEWQLIFFGSFLTILMVFLPVAVQRWWECEPLERTPKTNELMRFLREERFRCRGVLRWPLFEGKMMTAGIMGILPRYRYILITDSLLENLSAQELKAVVAHEMGHARYRHLVFYIIFFVGFLVLSFGLSDLFFYALYAQPLFAGWLRQMESVNLSYLMLSIPMLLTLLIYFRYVMGFFMRNFERQADLYSARIMGTPRFTVDSLEKIAFLSGKIRDLPSWHHFSIRERANFLWRSAEEPGLFRRHNRFVGGTFAVYVVCMVSLGYLLIFSPVKQDWTFGLIESALVRQTSREPENPALYQDLASLYHEKGRYEQAMRTYEKSLELDPNQPVTLNNLAWLLATVPDPELRDEKRALRLAERAVALEQSPVFLDTLAEAYYRNGRTEEAVEAIREAIEEAEGNLEYYESQLRKFQGGRSES